MAGKVKTAVLAGIGLFVLGSLVFGPELLSYARTSGRSVQQKIKNSIPTEFELQRARDLLEQSVPEMHANIRLIAEEEIEIEQLERDIAEAHQRLADQRGRIDSMRQLLSQQQVSYNVGRGEVSHERLRQELASHFERFKEAQLVQSSKQRLLEQRQAALQGAQDRLDHMRSEKALLAETIEALEAQHRLVQAAAAGSDLSLDSGKIAQTSKLIGDIRKRLDVAERVLAHEARFTEPMSLDLVTDEQLLAEVDEYFAEDAAVAGQGPDGERISAAAAEPAGPRL